MQKDPRICDIHLSVISKIPQRSFLPAHLSGIIYLWKKHTLIVFDVQLSILRLRSYSTDGVKNVL